MISIPLPIAFLGVISGLTLGVLAVGIVLIYRSSGVINFAHGQIGAFAAAALGVLVLQDNFPYWIALPVSLVIGGLTSMVVEAVAVRRLRRAPAVMSLVATLGCAAFLQYFGDTITHGAIQNGAAYPQPSGLPHFHVGGLLVTQPYVAELLVTPMLVVGLALFLKVSRYGVAIRAAASNRDAATMRGISPTRMSSLAWGLAGALSAYTAIMQAPSQGLQLVSSGQSLGPQLLVRALFVAVLARMSNIPVALIAGIVVGVVEQVMIFNNHVSGQVELMIFALTAAVLLTQRARTGRGLGHESWLSVTPRRPLPDALAQVWTIRNLDRVATLGLFGGLILVLLASNATALTFTIVVGYTLVGLSVYITTGLGGQLSLGQFALAGIGAVCSYQMTVHGIGFFFAFPLAGVATAVVAMILGVPALRLKGLLLAVVSLAFSVMATAWLFNQDWAFGSGVNPGQPVLGPMAIHTARAYFAFALIWLALGWWLCANIARGGLGRSLVGVRDNEDAARAFSLPATRLKLQLFAIAGFLAGLGGATYAHALPFISASTFPPDASITVVAMTVIGGVSLLAGPLLGALYLVALPNLVSLNSAAYAATSVGWLVFILYFPGGLAQLVHPLRERAIHTTLRLLRLSVEEPGPSVVEPRGLAPVARLVAAPRTRAGAEEWPILDVRDVARHYGGIRAVDGVSFTVRSGETLGLIGPNGAGKTTLFEIIGGFTRPNSGQVIFHGTDVSRSSPERHAKLGLLRSFQDARLFPTMTVLDVMRLAGERADPTRLGSALTALPVARRRERHKDERAREILEAMGLADYRSSRIAELSTGTRRITELACLAAMEPDLLLLDEPSSGIAQRETEHLAEVIKALKAATGATVIVIEHDMPLITGISDRMLAMDLGKIIAVGSPAAVCADPLVIDSYLGTETRALTRSGPARSATNNPDRCTALTRKGYQCSRSATADGLCAQHLATADAALTAATADR